MNETRRLADFIADTGFAGLPPALVERAKVYLLGNFAAALALAERITPRLLGAPASSLRGRPSTSSG